MAVGDVQRARLAVLVAQHGRGPWRGSELAAGGLTRAQARSLVGAGLLMSPRRGQWALTAAAVDLLPGDGPAPSVRSALAASIRAVVGGLRHQVVVSHESAAVLHGIALPGRPPAQITLQRTRASTWRRAGVIVRYGAVRAEDTVEVEGVRVTTVERTAVDVARGRLLPRALIPLDSAARLLVAQAAGARDLRWAVHDERARREALARLEGAYREVYGWPGTRTVRDALVHVDPAAESPAESFSRGHLHLAGLPPPVVGYAVHGASGAGYWSDLAWPGRRLLGEVDGWMKYAGDDDERREVWRRQSSRQRDLELAGWRLVRWPAFERPAVMVAALRPYLTRPAPRVTDVLVVDSAESPPERR